MVKYSHINDRGSQNLPLNLFFGPNAQAFGPKKRNRLR